MADIPSDFTITVNGSYTVPPELLDGQSNAGLIPGEEYILTFKSDDWGTAIATVQFNNGPGGTFASAEDGTFNADRTEGRFIAPSTRMLVDVSDINGNIKVTCVSSLQRVR